MTIKTIMVPIGNPDRAHEPLAVALGMARRFNAHVLGVHIMPDAKSLLPYATLGLSEKLAASVLVAADRNSEEIADRARAVFEAECDGAGVPIADAPSASEGATASVLVERGRATTIIAERGRLADMIVSRRPDTVHPSPPQLEAMLRETGRPVLLVPTGTSEVRASNIAVGWNGSSESASAVNAALPLMAAADTVNVLTTKKRAAMCPSANDVVEYLGWHGVTAGVHVMNTASRSVGEALAVEAGQLGVDLLVIGSYSRRRLREMVVGGVTGYLLEKANLPIMMVH